MPNGRESLAGYQQEDFEMQAELDEISKEEDKCVVLEPLKNLNNQFYKSNLFIFIVLSHRLYNRDVKAWREECRQQERTDEEHVFESTRNWEGLNITSNM